MRLFVVFVDLQQLIVCLFRLLFLADLGIYLSYLEQSLNIGRIHLKNFPEVGKRFLSGPFVNKCVRYVKMTLCRVRVDLERHLVRMDRLIKLLQHVVSVAEIEESGSIVRVHFNGFFVALNRLIKVLSHTESIAKVVVGFSLGWVLVYCFLVVLHCKLCLLKEVIGITEVVMNFCQVFVGLESFLEIVH